VTLTAAGMLDRLKLMLPATEVIDALLVKLTETEPVVPVPPIVTSPLVAVMLPAELKVGVPITMLLPPIATPLATLMLPLAEENMYSCVPADILLLMVRFIFDSFVAESSVEIAS